MATATLWFLCHTNTLASLLIYFLAAQAHLHRGDPTVSVECGTPQVTHWVAVWVRHSGKCVGCSNSNRVICSASLLGDRQCITEQPPVCFPRCERGISTEQRLLVFFTNYGVMRIGSAQLKKKTIFQQQWWIGLPQAAFMTLELSHFFRSSQYFKESSQQVLQVDPLKDTFPASLMSLRTESCFNHKGPDVQKIGESSKMFTTFSDLVLLLTAFSALTLGLVSRRADLNRNVFSGRPKQLQFCRQCVPCWWRSDRKSPVAD